MDEGAGPGDAGAAEGERAGAAEGERGGAGEGDGTGFALSRRTVLKWGIGVPVLVVAAAVAGVELGRSRRSAGGVLTGPAVSATTAAPCTTLPAGTSPARGPTYQGEFSSQYRHCTVGYSLSYPPGYQHGDLLPLAVYLHAYGGDHLSAYAGYPLAAALALGSNGGSLRPMAMICADGGDGYWHPRPGDDPMRMIVDELVPMCRRIGLGRPPDPVVVTGLEMGGYGALLLAERYPRMFAAAVALSPTIWTSYEAARREDPEAFTSADQFREFDVVRGAAALSHKPVRVWCGRDDPFRPGIERFLGAAPAATTKLELVPGSDAPDTLHEEAWPSLVFLSAQLPIPPQPPPSPVTCTTGTS
jgi:enterochelin esterase-like enzyme